MKNRIDSIFKEPNLLNSPEFLLTHDADPIVNGHLLIFPQDRSPNILGNPALRIKLFKSKTSGFNINDYILFEKGNAAFCTSLNGIHVGHIHLIPKKITNINELLINIPNNSIQFYHHQLIPKVDTEFVIIGAQEIGYHFIEKTVTKKRYIRKLIQKVCKK